MQKIDVKRVEHADGQGYTHVLMLGAWRATLMVFKTDRSPEIEIASSNSNYLEITDMNLQDAIDVLIEVKRLVDQGVRR